MGYHQPFVAGWRTPCWGLQFSLITQKEGILRARIAIAALIIAWLLTGAVWAVSQTAAPTYPESFPPALRSLPPDTLLQVFSFSDKPPLLAAEVARFRAWISPIPDANAVDETPRLAEVIRKYPATSDALRALTDLCGIYAHKGDFATAEAPFRYVMTLKAGQREGRIAHFRLIELHRYQVAPQGVDVLDECRAAITAYAGTPEEGLGHLILADTLAEKTEYDRAMPEFQIVLDKFYEQPYARFARSATDSLWCRTKPGIRPSRR